MGDIRFLAEIFQRLDWPPELALAANLTTANTDSIISGIYCARPETDTYWTDWGGTYDNPNTTNLQVYFSEFLQQVADVPTLLATENSFYIAGDWFYINTTYFPWQYSQEDTEVNISAGYSSAPANPLDPSNDCIVDSLGVSQCYPVRLDIPSISNKLSDPISGSALYSTFSFTLHNNDGFFDKTENTNLFNTPVFIKKANVDNPLKEDYTTVRYGLVSNMDITEDSIKITGEDLYRTLDEEVCKTVTLADYPSAPDSSIDKDIPIAYNGPFYNIDLLEVGTNQYLVCDPDYLDTVTAVYDSDGTSISFSVTDGVISATDADSCDFTAISTYNIGEIITAEMAGKSDLTYSEGIWDLVETDAYIALANNINLYFDGGDVKDLVKKCLESDNAFLISKNDGRLTLRQWGQVYTTHVIPNWQLTQFPTKSFMDRKYYASTVRVLYDYREADDDFNMAYIDDSKETILAEQYRKSTVYEFETLLRTEAEAIDLSGRLLDRFGGRNEVYKIASGYDTSAVNLLDIVQLDMTVNGRELSNTKLWIVKEVNVTQDTITLEQSAFTYYELTGGLLAEPSTLLYDGLLAGDSVLASVPVATEEE